MKNIQMVGVAKAMLINAENQLIGEGIIDTLDNSSISFSTSSTEIRGGSRNKLIDVYYHTPTGSATISNVSFNLDVIAANLGASVGVGTNVFRTEMCQLVGLIGTVNEVPQALKDGDTTTVYGWVCYKDISLRVSLNPATKTFTLTADNGIPENAEVAITYYRNDDNAQYIVIPASIIPQRIRVVLTAALSTNESAEGITGYAQWDIGVFQLAGSQEINMTPDGYATTELTGMILESGSGCVGVANELGGGRYAKATLILDDVKWYNNVTALAIEGGDFDIAVGANKTIKVYAVTPNKSFLAPTSGLTITSDTTSTATVANGVVTGVASGTADIKVVITEKTSIEAHATATVSA